MACLYCMEAPEQGKCVRDGCTTCCECKRRIHLDARHGQDVANAWKARDQAEKERDELRKLAYMDWCPFGEYQKPHMPYCVCGGDTSKITWKEWHENQSQGYALTNTKLEKAEKLRDLFKEALFVSLRTFGAPEFAAKLVVETIENKKD